MDFKQLAEGIDGIREDALFEASKSGKGERIANAMDFFSKGILPDGSKWGKKMTPHLGFNNAAKITRAKKKETKDGLIYTARLRFAPGKGGGSGVTIDAAASNHLFNMMRTTDKSITAVSKAFEAWTRKSRRGLGDALRVWLKKPDNFKFQIVGWNDRDKYTIDDVSFKGIRYEFPMVDPSRRKWPAGRTEIWQPLTADVVISLKRKKK